jgi:hypothetical protein
VWLAYSKFLAANHTRHAVGKKKPQALQLEA